MWFAEEFYHGLIKALTKLSNNEAKSSEKPKTTRERGPNSETLTNVEATLRDFIEGTAAKWTYACNLNGVDPKTVKRWARMVLEQKEDRDEAQRWKQFLIDHKKIKPKSGA